MPSERFPAGLPIDIHAAAARTFFTFSLCFYDFVFVLLLNSYSVSYNTENYPLLTSLFSSPACQSSLVLNGLLHLCPAEQSVPFDVIGI